MLLTIALQPSSSLSIGLISVKVIVLLRIG